MTILIRGSLEEDIYKYEQDRGDIFGSISSCGGGIGKKKSWIQGRKQRTETEVHNLTQLEIQNLLKEILQEKDKKLMIGFCTTEI